MEQYTTRSEWREATVKEWDNATEFNRDIMLNAEGHAILVVRKTR